MHYKILGQLFIMGQNFAFSQLKGTGNCLKFRIMVYFDHLQNWIDFGHVPLIFQIVLRFDLPNRAKHVYYGYLGKT